MTKPYNKYTEENRKLLQKFTIKQLEKKHKKKGAIKTKDKDEQRQQIRYDTLEFLLDGGKIKMVDNPFPDGVVVPKGQTILKLHQSKIDESTAQEDYP